MMKEGFQSPRHRHVDTGVEFTHPTDTTDEDMSGHEQSIFRTARKYIKTGRFFRPAMYLYAERKLILTFIVHFGTGRKGSFGSKSILAEGCGAIT
eukprot:scaffold119690_cov56-Attheya_sp.AAC.1